MLMKMAATLWALATVVGLATSGAGRADGPADNPSARVAPEKAAPGGVVHVTVPEPAFRKDAGATVQIGGQRATVVRVIGPTDIEVMVPKLPAGPAEVVVARGRDVVARGQLAVAPPSAVRLVLSMQGDRVTLISSRPAPGPVPKAAAPAAGARLAFDVLSDRNERIFAGAIAHPTGRNELFDDPKGKIRNEPAGHGPVVFSIKVPAPADSVRFYDVRPGVGPAEKAGAADPANRRYLGEVKLKKEGGR